MIQTPAPVAEAPSTIRLAAGNSVDAFIAEFVLRKAYGRLGYPIEISTYPSEVALRLADAGRKDGDVARIDGLVRKYPNLMQLHPPISYFEAVAFTADRGLRIDGWNSLRPFRIGLVRGEKFAELNTAEMDRVFLRDYPTLFRRLAEGRIEVAVALRVSGISGLIELDLPNITPVEPPLARFPLYHYIHRSRAELAPKLEAEFKSMQETGELTAIRQRVIAELMRRAEQGLPLCVDYFCFEPRADSIGALE